MRSILVLSVLVSACIAHVMRGVPHVHYGRTVLYGDQQQQEKTEQPSPLKPSTPVCYGLSRTSRTKVTRVPVLYNVVTGQSSPVPKNLKDVDPQTVRMLERSGWEVRTRPLRYSEPVYQKVQVCCPGDLTCQMPSSSPCVNGGRLIFKDGVKKCECPRGYKGVYCQFPDLIAMQQMNSQYRTPTAPRRLRVMVANRRGLDGIRQQAQIWKQKVLISAAARQALSSSPAHSPGPLSPRLSQQQHAILNSISGPYGQRAAVWHQQLMRKKIEEFCRLMKKELFERIQYQLMQVMQARGTPYGLVYTQVRQVRQNNQNPYSQIQNPYSQMQNPYSQRQNPYSQRQNPYSQVEMPNPAMVSYIQQLRNNQITQMTPAYKTLPRSAPAQGNPYNRVRPFMQPPSRAVQTPYGPSSQASILRPESRTPYDLDPFQAAPSLLTDPRTRLAMNKERQLVAKAWYEYMQKAVNDVTTRPSMRNGGFPGPIPSPPVNGMDFSAQVPPIATQQMPNSIDDVTLEGSDPPAMAPPSHPTSNAPTAPLSPHIPQSPDNMPVLQPDLPQSPNNPVLPGMPDVSSAAGVQGPPGVPGMPAKPQMPSPEEMKQMEQCRPLLEPQMNQCLDEFGLTLENFMNPDYMTLARQVCTNSVPVSQCVMSQDKACGDAVSQVTLTKKMIQSVMQMMGMVCQQIMARGDAPMPSPPVPPTSARPTGLPYRGSTKHPATADDSNKMIGAAETTNEMPVVSTNRIPQPPSTEDTEIPALPPTKNPENNKFHTTKTGKKSTDPTAAPQIGNTQPSTGHDTAQQILHSSPHILGYPAWLVVCLAVLLLVVLVMTVCLVCLCVRRKRSKTVVITKDMTRMPAPLDGKRLSIIGVPPPLYSTTIVNQTKEVDDLSLPPIDLEDQDLSDSESVTVSVTSSTRKVSVGDDADDESDETYAKVNKDKKKVKKVDSA